MTSKEAGGLHGALLGGLALYLPPDVLRTMVRESLEREELWLQLDATHRAARKAGLVNDPDDLA